MCVQVSLIIFAKDSYNVFPLEFLSYSRYLLEGNILDAPSSISLESDELVFEFLATCKNDVNIAASRIGCFLSGGKGEYLVYFAFVCNS